MKREERIEKLNAMGIETGKYFAVNLDNGTKIHIVIDENGNPQIKDDEIYNQIVEDGYVKNTKLHRRFVMAQMFHMLNYVSWDGKRRGYNEYLNFFGVKYSFEMMLEEIRVLSKLEERDTETFVERSTFFNRGVIVKIMRDYIEELKKYLKTTKTYNCKGVPYKKIKGRDVFVADLNKKVFNPLHTDVAKVMNAHDYKAIYKAVKEFYKKMVISYTIPKSRTWIDAYKGEGAFYTLKNLIMFHNCGIKVDDKMVYGTAAMDVLNRKLFEYRDNGWRMFGLMKAVIADNNFNYSARMREIYNK